MEFNLKTREKQASVVNYTNYTVRDMVEKWLHYINVPMDPFSEILTCAGLTGSSIEVSVDDSGIFDERAFNAKTNNQTYDLYLWYGDMVDETPQLYVKSQNEDTTITEIYHVYRVKSKVFVDLRGKTIKKHGMKCTNYYDNCFYTKELTTSNLNLCITIYEPNYQFYHPPVLLSMANDKIEKYIISLDLSKLRNLDEVWEKVKSILGFSEFDIKNCDEISFELTAVDDKKRALAKYVIKRGTVTDYAENDESGACLLVSKKTANNYEYTYRNENYDLRITGNGYHLDVHYTSFDETSPDIIISDHISRIYKWRSKIKNHMEHINKLNAPEDIV